MRRLPVKPNDCSRPKLAGRFGRPNGRSPIRDRPFEGHAVEDESIPNYVHRRSNVRNWPEFFRHALRSGCTLLLRCTVKPDPLQRLLAIQIQQSEGEHR